MTELTHAELGALWQNYLCAERLNDPICRLILDGLWVRAKLQERIWKQFHRCYNNSSWKDNFQCNADGHDWTPDDWFWAECAKAGIEVKEP